MRKEFKERSRESGARSQAVRGGSRLFFNRLG
jgi:hypothetical protein